MSAQNDDVMIGLLKNKINALENLIDENEQEYEAQIHSLKKKSNEQQRESNQLRSQIKELENLLGAYADQTGEISIKYRVTGDSKGPVKIGHEANLERKLTEAQEQLRKLTEENITLENRLEDALRRLQQSEIDSLEQSEIHREPFLRKNFRKRPEEVDKRRNDEMPEETLTTKLVEQTNEIPTLKKMIHEALEEKVRLEKINMELNRKVMTLMKTFEEEKEKEINKEKKKSELLNISLKRELEEIKRQKEDNEKKLFSKIILLEKKVNEREQQLKLLGDGIESLKRELQLREDPSHSSVQIVQYLEKFAKYQQEFVSTELRRFQDETTATKNDGKKREEETQVARSKHLTLAKDFETLQTDFELKKELLLIREDEITGLKAENNSLIVAMELLRREKTQVSNIRKANNEMVGGVDSRKTNEEGSVVLTAGREGEPTDSLPSFGAETGRRSRGRERESDGYRRDSEPDARDEHNGEQQHDDVGQSHHSRVSGVWGGRRRS